MPLCGAPPDFVGKTRGATPVSILKQNEGMTITYLLLNRQGLHTTVHTTLTDLSDQLYMEQTREQLLPSHS